MKDYQPFLLFGTLWLIILLAAMLKIKELRQEVAELEAKEQTKQRYQAYLSEKIQLPE